MKWDNDERIYLKDKVKKRSRAEDGRWKKQYRAQDGRWGKLEREDG